MSRDNVLHLIGRLLHAGRGPWSLGLIAFSLLLSYLVGLLLRRNQLRTILWRGFVLTAASLAIYTYAPSIVQFPLRAAPSGILTDEPQAPAGSNYADPLDLSYRPNIDTNPQDYPGNVWVTDSLQKVHQDFGNSGSVHWAILSAAKNEFGDFQVHVQAGASPV